MIPTGEPLTVSSLVTPTPHGIASRVLARTSAGNVTLFAFDADETLTEHTSPFDALAFVLDGACRFTVGGEEVHASTGTVVRLPAGVPHDVAATEPTRLLLVMLKGTQP